MTSKSLEKKPRKKRQSKSVEVDPVDTSTQSGSEVSSPASIRQLAIKPKDLLTEREEFLYRVYTKARSCVTGSMVKLCESLSMDIEDFYRALDTDVEFGSAIAEGLSDSRSQRLLELESSLITLALGQEIVEEKEVFDPVEGTTITRIRRRIPPNISAIQILLEKYEGSSWTVTQNVNINSGQTPQEIDYRLLSKEQLKILANKK